MLSVAKNFFNKRKKARIDENRTCLIYFGATGFLTRSDQFKKYNQGKLKQN